MAKKSDEQKNNFQFNDQSKIIAAVVIIILFTFGFFYIQSQNSAQKTETQQENVLEAVKKLLHGEENQLPDRVTELFEKWKKAVKKKQEMTPAEAQLTSTTIFEGDILAELAKILKTQPEHVPKTIERFLKELDAAVKK